jgi:hypothetical protein
MTFFFVMVEISESEAGKSYVGPNGTKLLLESCLKLPKDLKDALAEIMEASSWRQNWLAMLWAV